MPCLLGMAHMVRNTTRKPQGQGEAGTEEAGPRYHVERYGKTRNYALNEGDRLLGVMVYKRGGKSIQEELTAARSSPPGPATTRYQDRVWPETQGQLGFFTNEEKARFTARRRSSRGRA